MKTIKIACTGAEKLDLDEMSELQGDLKDLPAEAESQLRKLIEDEGFAFPLHVWKEPRTRKKWVIGGHQRRKVLLKMREDGYEIPKLPVTYVEARDLKHAKERVLQDVAQFGTVTPQGMYDFMQDSRIDISRLSAAFKLPDFDMPAFRQGFFPNEDSVDVSFKAKTGAKELDEDDFSKFEHKCPRCGLEYDEK